MSELNEKKAELRELDEDLRRLTTAVEMFESFDVSKKILFLGLAVFLLAGGGLALWGSYRLAINDEISIIYSFGALAASCFCLFLGTRILSNFFKLRNTLKRAAQIIESVRQRKAELEREIALFAE